jgi:DNA-binding response OmpR family regulator
VQQNAQAVVPKPFDPDALLATVTAVCAADASLDMCAVGK